MVATQLKAVSADLSEAQWLAISQNDAQADGTFFYGVLSTGIYCKPSCSARLPKVANVRCYSSALAAEAAGFRPCKRCKPQLLEAVYTRKIVEACRLLETAEPSPGLAQLAAHVGLSQSYFQRVFIRETGISPKAYAQAWRARKLQLALAQPQSVTAAMYAAGYQASSRFYAEAEPLLGMPVKTYRRGGKGCLIQYAVEPCRLGKILVAQTERGICAILLGDTADALQKEMEGRFPQAQFLLADADFFERVAQVIAFVESPALGLQLPLDIQGTLFQQRVWEALRQIPVGNTASYAEIASQLKAPGASRAVANACAANALAVAIPCHRVLRADGSLSGYRWGVERKRALLDAEKAALTLKDIKP